METSLNDRTEDLKKMFGFDFAAGCNALWKELRRDHRFTWPAKKENCNETEFLEHAQLHPLCRIVLEKVISCKLFWRESLWTDERQSKDRQSCFADFIIGANARNWSQNNFDWKVPSRAPVEIEPRLIAQTNVEESNGLFVC